MDNNRYVNSSIACAVFAFLLTFGFVWTSLHKQAPFTAYMEGLSIGLGAVLGKRLWQKYNGKTKSFTNNIYSKKKKDSDIPVNDKEG